MDKHANTGLDPHGAMCTDTDLSRADVKKDASAPPHKMTLTQEDRKDAITLSVGSTKIYQVFEF